MKIFQEKLMNIHEKTAEILIKIGSVNFNTKKKFTLTSGKLSPVYCDCRRIISFPKERKILINYASELLMRKKYFKKITNIAGGETAGIPFASYLSSKLNLPMTYIRKEKKKFGKKERIEGIMTKQDYVVLAEDLITDGGSKFDFLDSIRKKGAMTKAIFVIFNYGIYNESITFRKEKIDLLYLTNWKSILKVAKKRKILTEKDILVIFNFLKEIGVKN